MATPPANQIHNPAGHTPVVSAQIRYDPSGILWGHRMCFSCLQRSNNDAVPEAPSTYMIPSPYQWVESTGHPSLHTSQTLTPGEGRQPHCSEADSVYQAVDPYKTSIAHYANRYSPKRRVEEYPSLVANDLADGDKSGYGRIFITYTLPQQIYLHLLLRLPSMYWSRVARIFEDAELSLPDIAKMITSARVNRSEAFANTADAGPFLLSHQNHSVFTLSSFAAESIPKTFSRLTKTWEDFIDSMLKEWKILNIVSVLLLSAILSTLQIDSASADPVTRTAALLALVCALMSLLYGCMYSIRFHDMRKPHKAAQWAQEAQKKTSNLFWNVWVFLAMPAVWLAWSIIAYVVCILAYVWRIGPGGTPPSISQRALLGVRIAISAVLLIGTVYFTLIVVTLRRYGDPMDKQWHSRALKWVQEAKQNVSEAQNNGDRPRVPHSKPSHHPPHFSPFYGSQLGHGPFHTGITPPGSLGNTPASFPAWHHGPFLFGGSPYPTRTFEPAPPGTIQPIITMSTPSAPTGGAGPAAPEVTNPCSSFSATYIATDDRAQSLLMRSSPGGVPHAVASSPNQGASKPVTPHSTPLGRTPPDECDATASIVRETIEATRLLAGVNSANPQFSQRGSDGVDLPCMPIQASVLLNKQDESRDSGKQGSANGEDCELLPEPRSFGRVPPDELQTTPFFTVKIMQLDPTPNVTTAEVPATIANRDITQADWSDFITNLEKMAPRVLPADSGYDPAVGRLYRYLDLWNENFFHRRKTRIVFRHEYECESWFSSQASTALYLVDSPNVTTHAGGKFVNPTQPPVAVHDVVGKSSDRPFPALPGPSTPMVRFAEHPTFIDPSEGTSSSTSSNDLANSDPR